MSGSGKFRIGMSQLLIRDYDIILIDETFLSVYDDMELLIIERLFSKCPNKTFVFISRHASGN